MMICIQLRSFFLLNLRVCVCWYVCVCTCACVDVCVCVCVCVWLKGDCGKGLQHLPVCCGVVVLYWSLHLQCCSIRWHWFGESCLRRKFVLQLKDFKTHRIFSFDCVIVFIFYTCAFLTCKKITITSKK